MLTIMHRHDDGSETLYEAQAVTRLSQEDEPSPPSLGNVILRGCPLEIGPGPGAQRDNDGNIQLHFGARSSRGVAPMAFVMNESGATVATYRL